MRYIVDLSDNQNERIKNLMQKGQYSNIASFIFSAIENQLYLEESAKSVVATDATPSGDNATILKSIQKFDSAEFGLLLSRENMGNIPTIDPPEDKVVIYPPERKGSDSNLWVWGQVNRIFPLKLGVRVLSNMIKESGDNYVNLDNFRTKASSVAREIGLKLLAQENKDNRERELKVSSALPIGEPSFNSESRYRNHFLVSLRKTGFLDGASARFKFVNAKKVGRDVRVGITKGGLEFALLENPILDKNDYNISLSNEELDYYISYVRNYVPGEYEAMKWMVLTISKGTNKREAINDALLKKYPELGAVIVNTQRAGLMSRMFELGLLGREKTGVHVKYKVTEKGKSLLK